MAHRDLAFLTSLSIEQCDSTFPKSSSVEDAWKELSKTRDYIVKGYFAVTLYCLPIVAVVCYLS